MALAKPDGAKPEDITPAALAWMRLRLAGVSVWDDGAPGDLIPLLDHPDIVRLMDAVTSAAKQLEAAEQVVDELRETVQDLEEEVDELKGKTKT